MDIEKALRELRGEKKRLDRMIAALERRQEGKSPGGRVWNAAARGAASERMKKYWEQRKQATGGDPPAGG
ncbi:MAG: hypothetical protein HYR60_09140 [Acidobacteria bacterium]|nr:hypothetical protein [Acidobacteriota bacterium]MBI3473781.1 hypothetical protein [Candidatus Solibacter usitatus]